MKKEKVCHQENVRMVEWKLAAKIIFNNMKGDRIYQLALKKAFMDDADLNEVFALLMKAKKS